MRTWAYERICLREFLSTRYRDKRLYLVAFNVFVFIVGVEQKRIHYRNAVRKPVLILYVYEKLHRAVNVLFISRKEIFVTESIGNYVLVRTAALPVVVARRESPGFAVAVYQISHDFCRRRFVEGQFRTIPCENIHVEYYHIEFRSVENDREFVERFFIFSRGIAYEMSIVYFENTVSGGTRLYRSVAPRVHLGIRVFEHEFFIIAGGKREKARRD